MTPSGKKAVWNGCRTASWTASSSPAPGATTGCCAASRPAASPSPRSCGVRSHASDYLYSKGCRRIALIAGYSHQSPFKGRYEGYSKAIAAHGLEEILAESTQPVNSFEYGYECANQLLRDEPELDAILAPVDLQGLGVLRALKEQGIRVPEQVKVISMTGHAIGEMLETSMTSMEMPAFEMGEKAAQLTIMEIESPSEKAPTPQSIQFPYTLTQRETT